MDENYEEKYKKYKLKYMNMIKQSGGAKVNYNNAFLYYFNTPLRDQILLKFSNLNDLTRVDIPLENYGGAGSANGFVRKLTFNEDNNQLVTIAKISQSENADNSYFEFVNGKCINKLKEYYPNFVYTFNYGNIDDTLKKNLEDPVKIKNITRDSLVNGIKLLVQSNDCDLMKIDRIKEGCNNNSKSIFMIEYIPNSISLKELFFQNKYEGTKEQDEFRANLNYNMFCIIFQIYTTLSSLRDYFTHYDLHHDNIMISILEKPIIIEYKKDASLYKIKTRYIPYIIDYGRSYINCLKLDSVLFSRNFLETACEVRECGRISSQECDASIKGLKISRDNIYNYDKIRHYTDPRMRNISHDVRLFHIIFNSLSKWDFGAHESPIINTELYKHFSKYSDIFKEKIKKPSDYIFGVEENDFGTIPSEGDVIKNVKVVSDMLKLYHTNQNYNSIVTEADIVGVLRINMNFEEREKWTFTHK